MATAKTIMTEVPQPPVLEQRVVLELTMEEAQTLMDIVGQRVLGDPTGRRRHTAAVYDAFYRSNIRSTNLRDMSGEVRFKV